MARRRYQHPKVHATEAKRAQWYFRARVDVLTDSNVVGRREKTYYLGFCDELGKREAEKQRDAILSEAINKPQLMIQSQVKFKDVVGAYKRAHIPTLRANSQRGYEHVIDKWILPPLRRKTNVRHRRRRGAEVDCRHTAVVELEKTLPASLRIDLEKIPHLGIHPNGNANGKRQPRHEAAGI